MKANRLRLIVESSSDPYFNLALDEAILLSVDGSNSESCLRLWVNAPSAVVGCHESVEKAVDVNYCVDCGVEVIRRFTGGGTVYHDLGNLNWSFVTRISELPSTNIRFLYEFFSSIICRAVNKLGFKAYFAPPNRIDIDGHKISGMAGYIKRQAVLIHGTLLVSSDLHLLNRVCKSPPPDCPSVCNLKRYAKNISVENIIHSVMNTFSNEDYNWTRDKATEHETKLAEALLIGKYSKLSWNLSSSV